MSSNASVLFVCLGNICRSPLAEAALRLEAKKAGLNIVIDSAGTGDWHKGEPPDMRAQYTAHQNGVDISTYRARQIEPADFNRFTHIIALDRSNLAALEKMRPVNAEAEVRLLLDYVPGRAGQAVADPYYGTQKDFDITWRDVSEGAKQIIGLLTR